MEGSDAIKCCHFFSRPLHATIIFYTLGMSVLLPWNFFITANSYWQYKLRNTTLGENWHQPEVPLTNMQLTFMPALVIISNVTCLIFGFFTSGIARRVKERDRTLGAFFLTLTSLVAVTVLSVINTDEWQEAFFIITLVLVTLINVGSSVLQASLYGMIGFFPSGSIVALLSGQALAGVVSSLSEILSLVMGNEDPITSGIIYFCFADVFTAFSICAYMVLLKTSFYETFKSTAQKNEERKTTFQEYIKVLKKIFWIGFTFGLVVLISLSVFPAVQVYVTSTHSPSMWADVYFQPIITFLLFNLTDMIGREASRWVKWPSHNGYLFHIIAASRVFCIPLILLCNGANKSFPTLFHHDFYYITINSYLGLSNGYFEALTMVYYPRFIDTDETELAGTLMASLAGAGMVTGSCLSSWLVAVWGPNR